MTPIITSGLAILLTALGILSVLNGVQVPLGIPIIFNGWMTGGWRVGLFQIVLIAISVAMYYPFFKRPMPRRWPMSKRPRRRSGSRRRCRLRTFR